MGEFVIDSQFQSFADDFRLGPADERGVDFEPGFAFDSGFGGEVGHVFEGGDVFRAAVGVARCSR